MVKYGRPPTSELLACDLIGPLHVDVVFNRYTKNKESVQGEKRANDIETGKSP